MPAFSLFGSCVHISCLCHSCAALCTFSCRIFLAWKTSRNTSHKVYVKVVFVLPVYCSQMPQVRNCQLGPVEQQMSTLASANILCCWSFGCLPRGAASWCLADFLSFNILFWLIWSKVVLRRWDHDTLWDKQFVTQPFSLLRRLCIECQASLVLPDITSVSVSQSVSQSVVQAAGHEPALQPCWQCDTFLHGFSLEN